ncbi:MAG: toll/interleukin-1 receptor domain-containing protein [Bacteroidales bacterium]|nr:toll/interleukin-1 receptor domain-containing protein [Bacteroidales bacterium]
MGFKPKENSSAQLLRLPEAVFSQEQFVDDVFNDDYILVVGSEVVMNTDEECTGDVKRYILNSINSKLGTDYNSFDDLYRYVGRGIDPVRNILYSEDFTYSVDDLSPELRRLFETKLFRFVMTTTFDSYLEVLMEYVWGKGGYSVVNMGDKASVDRLRNELAECREGDRYMQPTLFYIFGKAEKDESKSYVRNDDDAIQIIDKWIQLPKDDPMVRHIRNKKILALGCKFDDWYFRFFWYNLKRDISRLREGQVAFMLDENDTTDAKLDTFLKHSMIYRHKDVRAFMSHIAELLTSTEHDNPLHDMVVRKRREGGVFLSYCSKDFIMASRLFFMLQREGFDVWFDNMRLKGGDDYNGDIENAIGKAKVFVPLLTPSVAADLTAGETDNYYNKEWLMAAQTGDKAFVPVAANGYNLREDYHTKGFEPFTSTSNSGIDLMGRDGCKKLIESITKHLHRL